MLLIINKQTKKIIENMGTNSAFPCGNIPNLSGLPEGQEYARIHDNSELAQEIMSANDCTVELSGDKVNKVTVHKTHKQYTDEFEVSPERQAQKEKERKKKRIEETNEKVIDIIEDMFEFCVSKGFRAKKEHEDIIIERKQLKNKEV